jgi:5-methylcytosine-specific restriction protein A
MRMQAPGYVRIVKAPSVCSTPGCPEIVEKGSKCPAHRAKRARSPQHYNSAGWKRTSARYLKAHPLCECDECSVLFPKSLRPRAQVVNHIVDVKDGGTDDWSNLQSMTKSHHSRHTARTKPGGFNSFQQRDRLCAGRPSDRPNPSRDQRRTGG